MKIADQLFIQEYFSKFQNFHPHMKIKILIIIFGFYKKRKVSLFRRCY